MLSLEGSVTLVIRPNASRRVPTVGLMEPDVQAGPASVENAPLTQYAVTCSHVPL